MWVKSGAVVTDEEQTGYIGAQAQTNNTGEMTAMYYALKRALRRPPGEEHTHIRSDSLYNINMTTGKWIPRTKRNREFVSTLRGMWREVQRRRAPP